MATTTNYSWTTPDDTALVKDGAAAIRTLGSSVDTTVKNLNPETTLGDLAYRSSTANVNTRLAIGTTGQVLAVSGGVPAWTTPASAAPGSAQSFVTTSQSTTSTSFTDLATSQSITLTTGTKVMVVLTSNIRTSTGGDSAFMGFEVSGASTVSATTTKAIQMTPDEQVAFFPDMQISAVYFQTVTAGSNTFTAKFRCTGGSSATFANRQLLVIDLGS